jgi:hypothetical protein
LIVLNNDLSDRAASYYSGHFLAYMY